MAESDRVNIRFKPAEIKVEEVKSNTNLTESDLGDLAIANKFVRHLNIIQEYKDRIEAIDYLISGAKEKAGNPEFSTTDPDVLAAIQKFTGTNGRSTVDIELFEQCIDVILKTYEEQALASITGVLNA